MQIWNTLVYNSYENYLTIQVFGSISYTVSRSACKTITGPVSIHAGSTLPCFEGCCDPGMGRLIGRRHPWCSLHQLQGSHVFVYFLRMIIKIPPWQGARRWPTREAPMLQGAEGRGPSWDHLWRRHPTSAGVNYEANLVFMLALPLMLVLYMLRSTWFQC